VKERSVLVVESDAASRRALEGVLRSLGYRPAVAVSIDEAVVALGRDDYLCCLLDARLAGRDGLELLRRLRNGGSTPTPVILIADEQDAGRMSEATALGADDFLPKRFQQADLENVLKEVEARPRAVTGPMAPATPASTTEDSDDPADQIRRQVALWRSPRMSDVWETIQQAARVDVTVLIEGETGTGKDVVARAIHQFSSRRSQPFVKVNCAAMPRELLESELFGHERGAFTGAHQTQSGKFEHANRGTIFLDEIGDLHPALQAKLLHVLQDGIFSRVGGRAPIEVDVRVLAATNRDLEREVEATRFREDLYYRLNVIQIVVPPLRERMEELPLLADHFAQRYAKLFHRAGFVLLPGVMERLAHHRFPGNVRELENLVKRMIVLDDPGLERTPFLRAGRTNGDEGSGTVTATGPVSSNGASRPAPRAEVVPLKEVARTAARAAEREAIARVLEQTGWNRVRAAKLLKISYRALLYKIKEVGLGRVAEPSQ
jgi:two-component system, NtrC family, response regulator AtoC